jgi:hypothetical protein
VDTPDEVQPEPDAEYDIDGRAWCKHCGACVMWFKDGWICKPDCTHYLSTKAST